MKHAPKTAAPPDASERKRFEPVICYPVDSLPAHDHEAFDASRATMTLVDEVTVRPRDAEAFEVSAGRFFRILCPGGSQVGDLNLWNAQNLSERMFTGKTRALHGTHVSTGDKLWSTFPSMRPLATITHDTLDWYGWDDFGGSVHDVIGTRCDPYTNALLTGEEYHYCCHSNLTRALANYSGTSLDEAEPLVHDVLNVFMCSGFTPETKQYFIKASPVRAGDYLELFAEIDLVVGLSTCPGGDCSTGHSSDEAVCAPLVVQVFEPESPPSGWASPKPSNYSRSHGVG